MVVSNSNPELRTQRLEDSKLKANQGYILSSQMARIAG